MNTKNIMKEDNTGIVLIELNKELFSIDYSSIQFVGKNCVPATIFKVGNKIDPDTLKCAYYDEYDSNEKLSDFERGYLFATTGEMKETRTVTVGCCNGTKEREVCKCNGDIDKCEHHYKEKR